MSAGRASATTGAILLALISTATGAAADTSGAKKQKPTHEQVVKYKAAMKRGQDAGKANDLDGAVAAFREASTTILDDARALSELGLAALHKKDLKLAEEATRRSIQQAADPSVKGASLYNLGRILEEKNDKPGAVDAYVKSLTARPNATVRERLAGLDAQAAAALDPVAPHPMLGPYARLGDYCAAVAKSDCSDDFTFACKPVKADAKIASPKDPFQAVWLVSTRCFDADDDNSIDLQTLHLAIQTSAGWFVTRGDRGRSSSRRCEGELKESKVSQERLLPDGGDAVTLRFRVTGDCTGGDTDDTTDDSYLLVAGVGTSGKPSATSAINVAHTLSEESMSDDDSVRPKSEKWKLDVKFAAGQIDVEGEGRRLDAKTKAELLGKHAFVFP